MVDRHSDARSGLVACTRCPWRGIPTYLTGTPQPECPACKAPTKETRMTESVKFDRGQLILAPYKGNDVLWTVLRVAKSGKATLIASFERFTMEITTTVTVLPDDWSVVSQGEAIYALTGKTDGEVVAG